MRGQKQDHFQKQLWKLVCLHGSSEKQDPKAKKECSELNHWLPKYRYVHTLHIGIAHLLKCGICWLLSGVRWDGTIKASTRANYTLPLSHLVNKTNLKFKVLDRKAVWLGTLYFSSSRFFTFASREKNQFVKDKMLKLKTVRFLPKSKPTADLAII